MIRIPEEVRNFYASKALEHKTLSYEERTKFFKNHKITYHSLKTIYEQMNVPKQHYKEEPTIFNLKKTCSTDFQVQQLLALELSEIKMRRERLVYLDYVQVQLSDMNLIIGSFDAYTKQDFDPRSQYCWVIAAIDSTTGIVGFSIYKEKADTTQCTIFIQKLADKVVKMQMISSD